MSLIPKTDEKSQLSARHRTEIHLVPEGETDATGYPHEEPVGANAEEGNSIENQGNVSTAGGAPATGRASTTSGQIATPKSVKN